MLEEIPEISQEDDCVVLSGEDDDGELAISNLQGNDLHLREESSIDLT